MLGVLSILYQNVDWKVVAITLPVIPILIHVIPYLVDSHKIRKYPGPFFAKFSDIWSQKSVLEFEPQIRLYVGQFIGQWDRLCDMAVKGSSGKEGEGGWRGENGRLWLDCLPCKLYFFWKT